MSSILQTTPQLIKEAAGDWLEDKAPQLGASLAFYAALSISPLLVLLVAIAAFFLGEEAAAGRIDEQFRSLLGEQGADSLQDLLKNANHPTAGITATILSIVTLLFGASGVFGQLQAALNAVWEVEPKPGAGVWGFIRQRFLSITMVLVVAFLLLVSLAVSAFLASLGGVFDRLPVKSEWLLWALNIGASFIVIAALFAMLFKYLPDVKIAWRDVWFGAIVTSALFLIGKAAIGLYLGRSSTATTYGMAGSFVVLLLWVYYSAQIFFFGAELTQVYAKLRGARIRPAEGAQRIDKATASPKKA
jgi:membrane protein